MRLAMLVPRTTFAAHEGPPWERSSHEPAFAWLAVPPLASRGASRRALLAQTPARAELDGMDSPPAQNVSPWLSVMWWAAVPQM